MTAEEIVQGASVPGWPRVFVIGSFDTRITFFSQQVRALNLVDALVSTANLNDVQRIAVIGAGAAGLAASAALALLMPNAEIDVFESEGELLHLQRGCSSRNLHPHIYDWPKEGSIRQDADLPILSWSAGSAATVADAVTRSFNALKAALGERPNIRELRSVTSIEKRRGAYSLYYRNEAQSPLEDASEAYDAVFLAIGFGFERELRGASSRSYWSDEGTPGPAKRGRRITCLVSGAGDGGLIDLAAAALSGFDHSKLIKMLISYPAIDEISERLIKIDELAGRAKGDFDFMEAYHRDLSHWADEVGLRQSIRSRLRPPRQNIIFNTAERRPLQWPTATLNRMLAYLILTSGGRGGAQIKHMPGRLSKPDSSDDSYLIGDAVVQADEVFVRHGPDKDAAFAPFKVIREAYEPVHAWWIQERPERANPPELTRDARRRINSALANYGIRPRAPRRPRPTAMQPLNAARVLRICALPVSATKPRPVNLLMVIGVSRRPSIIVTVGVDTSTLLHDLAAVEEMVRIGGGDRFATRTWEAFERRRTLVGSAPRGLLWRLGVEAPTKVELARALAELFRAPLPECGDVLVLALPSEAEAKAIGLVEKLAGCGESRPLPGAHSIPIHAWSRDRILTLHFGDRRDLAVERLLGGLAGFLSPDAGPAVRDAYAMRLHSTASPPRPWDHADSETLRIHDLSLLQTQEADHPGRLEDDRATAIIPKAEENHHILYALGFFPISIGVLTALANASTRTRAVAGLLTREEAGSLRPSWSRNEAAGYLPPPLASFVPPASD